MLKSTHGGDIYIEGKERPFIDFSANVNPFGLPKGVIEVLKRRVADFSSYPDPFCRDLRAAIAEKEGVLTERIVCGNGAADLIVRLVAWKKPKRALVTAPTFSEYEKALKEVGCHVIRFPLASEAFEVTDEIFDQLRNGLDMVFLCNPNNPTGKTITQKRLLSILGQCERQNILLLVDECFHLFLDRPKEHTLSFLLREGKEERSLILLRAFTKTYGMAGLRLGYALCGSEAIAQGIELTGQPWSVSTPAQLAGVQALKEQDYLDKSCQLIRIERERMKDRLLGLGMDPVMGEANYLLFKVSEEGGFYSVASFQKRLKEKGFLLRSCENYEGLGVGYFRIAIRKPKENDLLFAAIRELQGKRREG